MAQALISINTVIGSNDNLPIATIVQLDNVNVGGELTYSWSILDQPLGPVDSLSAPNIQNPTFTPKKEGTYLIRLIVNLGLPTEQRNQVIAAIRQLKTLERIPAAGETLEDDSIRGWATSTNELLQDYEEFLADGAVFVGVNASGSSFTRGTVVKATASSVIKSGLPGQETVPGFSPALSTLRANVQQLLCVVEQTVAGLTTVPAGALFQARYLGRIGGIPLGTGSVGDTVYVNDSGQLSTTPGTVRRQVGSIMSASGTNRDVFFDGVGGADITPIDAPYVTYGNPGMLTNAFRVDGDNATPGATSGNAWTFKSGDDSTRSVVAKRHSASQTVNILEATKEDDTIAYWSVGPTGTLQWQTDTADANGVAVGAMQWRDVNSSASDKRIAQLVAKLNGATADNRGGEVDVLIKLNGASGLINVATFGPDPVLNVTGLSTGSGNAIVGTGGSSTTGIGVSGVGGPNTGNIGVKGTASGSNGIGVRGIGTGPNLGGSFTGGATGGAGVQGQAVSNGTGGTGGVFVGDLAGAGLGINVTKGSTAFAAIQTNGAVALIMDSDPTPTAPGTTGPVGTSYAGSFIGGNILYRNSFAKCWGSILTGTSPTIEAGLNIESITFPDTATIRVTFGNGFMTTTKYAVVFGTDHVLIPVSTNKQLGSFDFQVWAIGGGGAVEQVTSGGGAITTHIEFAIFSYQ